MKATTIRIDAASARLAVTARSTSNTTPAAKSATLTERAARLSRLFATAHMPVTQADLNGWRAGYLIVNDMLLPKVLCGVEQSAGRSTEFRVVAFHTERSVKSGDEAFFAKAKLADKLEIQAAINDGWSELGKPRFGKNGATWNEQHGDQVIRHTVRKSVVDGKTSLLFKVEAVGTSQVGFGLFTTRVPSLPPMA